MEEKLICGLTATEIEDLKLKYGALVLVEVGLEEDKSQVIFKEPTFDILRASNKLSKADEMKALETIYHNCLVVVDPLVVSSDILKIKAVEALMARISKTQGEAKNL